jgi:hypothetical protein
MHQSANALCAAFYGAPLVPNADIDRHGPGGAMRGEQSMELGGGRLDQKRGRVRGRMQRLGISATIIFWSSMCDWIQSDATISQQDHN